MHALDGKCKKLNAFAETNGTMRVIEWTKKDSENSVPKASESEEG